MRNGIFPVPLLFIRPAERGVGLFEEETYPMRVGDKTLALIDRRIGGDKVAAIQ
jgi:hypothetical protein